VGRGLLGLYGRRVQQPLGIRAGPPQDRLRLRAGQFRLVAKPLPGLLRQPLRLGAGGRERLLRLGARLLKQPTSLCLRAGAQLLGPGHVLVDVRLDGAAAVRELLVQLPAPGDRLGVQLRLQPGLLLGVLLQDPLVLGAGLAQLALRIHPDLVGLHLGVAEQLFGLIADIGGVEGRTGRQGAARLVELGAQHLDLVAEVLGVLDGLLPFGLQPIHLGFEP
jgi:hypothetical protein